MTAETTLPLDDIQGIIMRGYGHKTAASFFLLEVADPKSARTYLAKLNLTSASEAPKPKQGADPFVNVAFSHRGIAKLSRDPQLVDDFPREFVESSDTEERTQMLGDVGQSASINWRWGNTKRPVDVLLLVYASTDEALVPIRQRFERELPAAGLSPVVPALPTKLLPGRSEHFGFRDGIAQPIIRGSGREELSFNTLAAGEFLLGHDDGYGQPTHCPTTSDGFEFGCNGSYLVLRQLEQDVAAFWRFCDAQSGPRGAARDAATLASKMVGRWPSGAPIVKYPNGDPKPGQDVDEDRFGYDREDPAGLACPFGAHIRRSNPRDWNLGADRKESMELANLHRIMRRGRAYGPPLAPDMSPDAMLEAAQQYDPNTDTAERGLNFICFNANIERQFEFVQQQWCNNPKFAGLNSDADPLFGWHRERTDGVDEAVFTVPATPFRRRAKGIRRFVHVRGSSYFFMPSISAVQHLVQH